MIGRIFLGRYQATRLLGEGGMGRVFLARQLDLGRPVVIKVMHDHIAADQQFRERFQRETLLMARFQHPYAVTLYDASLDSPDGPCIIMEYIRGLTLDVLLTNNGRLSAPRVGRLLGQLCEVLQAAHSEGVVHRDLKPANLMVVDPDTPYEKIKVMDFGLATLLDPATLKKMSQTNTEFAVGTPGYMSPEQIRGEDMDQRGDLYSLGVILYELLTGKLPFSGKASMEVMLAHATEDPPNFFAAGAGDWVTPEVEAVVMACLAKDPAQRPACARVLAERFEAALFHDEAGPPPAPPPSVERQVIPKAPAVPVQSTDANEIVHQFEAWMPESIAVCKLRGFVQDVDGEVIESVPGRVRVRLEGKNGAHTPTNPLAWFGLGRKPAVIELELRLQRAQHEHSSLLRITVLMRPWPNGAAANAEWRTRCTHIYCDLRAYLMGQSDALIGCEAAQ